MPPTMQTEWLRGLLVFAASNNVKFVGCRRVAILFPTSHQETHMVDPQTTIPEFIAPPSGKPYTDMTSAEKMTWIGKCFIMMITGGFAFPNIFVE